MLVIILGIIITLATCIPVFTQMRQHPKGLHILFFAEMWERFSYYGMRGLLIFYLTQHFLFDDRTAQGQYGSYTALVYLLPLLGGFLADKYLGSRKAIAFGALLLVAGHLTMGMHGPQATQTMKVDGVEYNLAVEGRGGNRQVFVETGTQRCLFGAVAAEGECSANVTPDGGIAFTGLEEGSPMPEVVPNVMETLSEPARNPLFTNILFLALALIVMGVGYLKANISSIVGQLYEENDPRRDGGFTLYYYGINLGAFWASILCGYLGQQVGWWAGFGLAAIGMAFGWLVFTRRRLAFWTVGEPQLPDSVGAPPNPEQLAKKVLGPISLENMLYLLAIPGVAVVWYLLQTPQFTFLTLMSGLVLFGGYIIFYMITKCTWRESQELILALFLIFMSVVFWSLFEQGGSSLNQFAERNTQLPNDGFMTVTAAQTQSFNSGFILLFAPVFAALWAWLGTRKHDPNTALKFGLALVQVGLGFWVLVWGAQFADESYRVPLMFLVLAYLLHTTGELCLSPVGLSMVTKLSPAAVVSFMMAGWFLSSAFAQYVAGIIAQFTASDTVAGQVLDPGKALETYTGVFWSLGVVAIILGVLLGLGSFLLKYLGHGKAGRLASKSALEAEAAAQQAG
ncbi:oligopeptide:H+ symporter [Hyphomonas sp.]|uniref:peptide MFS transporter n=1 Tax=Hyphomonas sp. TaxID=87 RepID=UPI0025BA36E2|nr:oligopeptide:H+ symporter [Hyphomonas sp.]MBI1399289.1 MFS transporter [Hyphomonas sp.]